MRLFLRKSWAPLPVSALALSSTRGGARRSAAASTRTNGRAAMRMPAWISGGGASTGGGDDRVLREKKRLSREVPLVQEIYDELRTMRDPEAEARKGLDSPVISKVLRLMDDLEASDLGVSESDFRGLERSLCVPVVAGRSEGDFEMAMFVLPAGGAIPLHDHPNMAVLSRVLFGSLEVDSYDVAVGDDGDEDEAMSDVASATKKRARAAAAASGGGSGGGSLRRGAVSRRPRAVDSATPSFLLTPFNGNVHAFRAPVACAVFDVLIPPYDNSRGRKCSYFRVQNPSPVTASAAGGSSAVDKADNEPERVGGELGRLGEDVSVEGKGERDPIGKRVVLEEIPEPEGLPRWSRYHGPEVLQQ